METSSVYSFLATITKDHGEIDASVELLKVREKPTNFRARWLCIKLSARALTVQAVLARAVRYMMHDSSFHTFEVKAVWVGVRAWAWPSILSSGH